MQDVTTRTHIIAVDHEAPRAGAGHPVPESAQPSWQAEVGDLLVRAAQACSQHGVDLDAFM